MFEDYVQEPLAPVNHRRLFAALEGIGVARLDEKERRNVLAAYARTRGEYLGFDRLDANEAGLLGVEIENLIARQRDVLRPEFKWRTFVPVGQDAPVGALSWSTVLWDATGMAELV